MKKKWKEKFPIKCFFARYSLTFLLVISIIFLVLGLFLFFLVLFDEHFFHFSFKINLELANQFGTLIQGLVGTIFGIAGALLVAITFLHQSLINKKSQIENVFFRMLDYHRDNVRNIRIKSYKDYAKKGVEKIEGGRAFVLFKLQIFDLLKVVQELNTDKIIDETNEINLAYMLFYFGIDKEWDSFTNIHLKDYGKVMLEKIEQKHLEIIKNKKKNIGRTNQTVLSAYFRNMYNAIKYIDENIYLSKIEKYQYIKMYRAQLSNSEQAVFYF
ncbi:MAG: hypothetical protein GQ534_06815, partial [Candidatus Delongbacteria bacterium]|nr:hypothetical protein [Candidatus Delongbacteria bacterium]